MSSDNDVIQLPASRPEDVEAAEKHLRDSMLVLSGNRYQPKIVWTIRPWTRDQIRARVEAGGASPFLILDMMPLDRRALRWAGAPHWAQYAWLLMVEVKATIVG